MVLPENNYFIRVFNKWGRTLGNYSPYDLRLSQIPADVLVFKEGDYAVAVDGRTKEVIARSTDHAEVIQKAVDYLPVEGGLIYVTRGIYKLYSSVVIEDKQVSIVGSGTGSQFVDWGTVVKKYFDGDILYFKYSDHNTAGFRLEKILFDGRADSQTGNGIVVEKAKGWFLRDVIVKNCYGNCLRVLNCGWHRIFNSLFAGAHNHIIYYKDSYDWQWYMVEADTVMSGDNEYDAIHIEASHGVIIGGHFESGWDHGRYGISIADNSRVSVLNSIIFACGLHGIQVYGQTAVVVIAGNRIRDVNGVGVNIASSKNVLVIGNLIQDTRETPIMDYGVRETGTSDGNIIIGNIILNMYYGGVQKIGSNTVVKWNKGHRNENSGTAVFSGDGTTTQFKVEHGLVAKPSKVIVTPLSADAKDFAYAEADDTYIYFNFDTAPPSGTDNVKLSWYAEV